MKYLLLGYNCQIGKQIYEQEIITTDIRIDNYDEIDEFMEII